MSENRIEVRNLRRAFGAVVAVDDLSFDIAAGQVVGFIGANGAGKTTTMRMLVTLDVPDGGSIRVGGLDVTHQPGAVRRLIGWMPDAYGTYDYTTVWEYLDFYARAFGYRGAARARRIDEVMAFTDLAGIADRPMNKLSKGMAQRLCLGRTLLHDPPVLVLDEPAAGLDPKARVEFKHLVRLLAAEGKTLFISSHILSELEEMCDTMLFIDQGRLVHHGSAESLRRGDSKSLLVTIEVTGDPAALHQWLALNPGAALHETTRHGARVRLEAEEASAALADLLRRLVRDGLPVCHFGAEQTRLEDAFVNRLNRGPEGAP